MYIFLGGTIACHPLPNDWIQVAVGDGIICGRHADHTLQCVGDGFDATPPAGAFLDLSASSFAACGIRESNRAIECWGEDTGSLLDPPAYKSLDVSVASWQLEDETHLACGLDWFGHLYCWGVDGGPVLDAEHSGTWSQIALEGEGVAGIDAEGHPQCGDLSNNDCGLPEGTATKVVADLGTTCVIYDTGSVACTGSIPEAAAGLLWDRHSVDLTVNSLVACTVDDVGHAACPGIIPGLSMRLFPELTPPGGSFTLLSAGTYGICGVRTDGTMVCWGDSFRRPPALGDLAEVVDPPLYSF